MLRIPVIVIVSSLALGACRSAPRPGQVEAAPSAQAVRIANPASQNCIDEGGTLTIERRPDGGEFGVCTFEDNRQCEEWALLISYCPVGGLKVTGYFTPAARYCAITGGTYTVTSNSNTAAEQGTCSFEVGYCDAWEYYEGACTRQNAASPATISIQPLPVEICDGQAQAMASALGSLEVTQSEAPFDDPSNRATGTGCLATVTGTGEQFESIEAVLTALESVLLEQGWTADPLLAAGGPAGACSGFRKGDQIASICAQWHPDASANCPQDQPISVCQVTAAQQLYTITLNSGVEVDEGTTSTPDLAAVTQLIVFDSNRASSGYRDLYVMNALGNDVSRLTRGESNSFAGPWSPDGKQIVYTTFGLTSSQIATIKADGSQQSILESVDESDEAFPAWSPDGSRIAFTSRRDGNNEIYLMNTDGSHQIRLTVDPGDDFAPSWSPDGTRLVFVSDRDQSAGIYDLYIMDADGSGLSRLTNDTAIEYSPDWSPDGKKIVFRAHNGGPADIYTINIDGTELTNLTDHLAEDWAPSWSPDGSLIAFQTDRDGNWEIYRMAASGSDPVNLTNSPSDDQSPYFRP